MTDVTRLLRDLADGRQEARERLIPLVYAELYRLAHASMRGQDSKHTLQPTEVLNEAWLRMFKQKELVWNGRHHFLGVAARAMRSVLVDHARRRQATKRGNDQTHIQIDGQEPPVGDHIPILEIHDALETLATIEPDLARLVELRYFGGLSVEETAEVLQVSTRTVMRNWRTAQAWLARALDEEEAP